MSTVAMSPAPMPLTAEQQKLVASASPLIRAHAFRRNRRTPSVSVDDLTSAGHEALVQLTPRYNSELGTYASFANARVHLAMMDLVRKTLSGRRREVLVASLEPGEPLADLDMDRAMAATPETERGRVMETLHTTMCGALAVSVMAEGEDGMLDQIERQRAKDAVVAGVSELGPPKDLVIRRFLDGHGQEEIADEVGLSVRTVERTLRDFRERMRFRLRIEPVAV